MKYSIENWLSFNKTNLLRILMAYGIVFHHLSFNLDNMLILKPFNYIGFLFSGVFFFLSGYGLYESKKKKKTYFEKYFGRVLKIFIPFLVVFAIYFMVDLIIEKNILFNYKLFFLVQNCWYVYEQLAFYLIFYFLFRNENKHSNSAMYIIVILFVLLTCNKIDSFWWKSSIAFPFGITFAKYKDFIFEWMKSKLIVKEIGILLLSIFILFLIKKIQIIYLCAIFYQLLIIMFYLFICGALMMINVSFAIKLKCSYEIYLIHGLFIKYISINNYIKIFIVLIASTVFSVFLNIINSIIFKKLKI